MTASDAARGSMGHAIHLVLSDPCPRWQHALATALMSRPDVDLSLSIRASAPGPASWRHVARQCPMLLPAERPALPASPAGEALTIDLTDAPEPGSWSLRDQHAHPLAAPFPFCRGGRLEMPEVLLRDGGGTVLAQARLARQGPYAATLAYALGWAVRLVEQALGRPLEGRAAPGIGAHGSLRSSAPRPVGWAILARDLAERARGRLRSWLVDETWAVGVIDKPIEALLEWPGLDEVAWIEAPGGAYYADPFGMPGEDRILCERFDHDRALGRLVTLRLERGRHTEGPLDFPPRGHVSFPYLARIGDALLCIPENAASRQLALWQWGEDGSWQASTVVAENIHALDPVLFGWRGRFWIAYTDGSLGEHDNLCLLHAASLDGPWQPHAGNPVKVDVGSSRPGGTPFMRDGYLYRPAQDCGAHYGAAIVVNRVLELTTEAFAEEPVARLAPGRDWPYPDGLHTLSAWGDRTLIDAKRHGFVPAAFARRLRGRLSRGQQPVISNPIAANRAQP